MGKGFSFYWQTNAVSTLAEMYNHVCKWCPSLCFEQKRTALATPKSWVQFPGNAWPDEMRSCIGAKLSQLTTYKTWGHLKCITYVYKTSDISRPDIYETLFYPENWKRVCNSKYSEVSHNFIRDIHSNIIITFTNHQTKIKFHLSAFQLNDLHFSPEYETISEHQLYQASAFIKS